MTTIETQKTNDRGTGPIDPLRLVLLVMIVASIAWASWPSFADMERTWSGDTRYSHGFLVPLFSLYLLWHRREYFQLGNGSWLGLFLLLIGGGLKIAGGMFSINWLDGVSLLPTLAGVCLVMGGRPTLRWAWPAIAFLFFMIPLPWLIETAIGPQLQKVATLVSTYVLQTLGLPAQAEGNVINMDDVKIGVVEACNGLGMLMMFFAYATAVAIVVRRPLIDRIIIILSAAPIAMIANIFRISLTGLLHSLSFREAADHFYHDLAGWLMMPMALAMFGLEMFLLSKLFIDVEPDNPAKSVPEFKPLSPLLIDVRSIPKGIKRKLND